LNGRALTLFIGGRETVSKLVPLIFKTSKINGTSLETVSLPPIKSVKALPFNTPIPIQNAEAKRTRFGEKTMLTWEDFVVFLSERFSSLPPKLWSTLRRGATS